MLSLSKYEGLWSVSPFMRSLVLDGRSMTAGQTISRDSAMGPF